MARRMIIGFIVAITACVCISSVAVAAAVSLRFTETQMPLGNPNSYVELSGNEYISFGITTQHIYRYADSRDPFSDGAENFGGFAPYGLSLSFANPGLARINFTNPVSALEVDWWTIQGTIYLDVYTPQDVLLYSFNGFGSGTQGINFSNIGYMTWHDTGGFVQVSNIRFDTVPEPGTLLLIGGGLLGLAVAGRKRIK